MVGTGRYLVYLESRTKRGLSSAVYRLSPPVPITPNAPAAGLTRPTTLNPGSILLSARLSRALRWCAFPAVSGTLSRRIRDACLMTAGTTGAILKAHSLCAVRSDDPKKLALAPSCEEAQHLVNCQR